MDADNADIPTAQITNISILPMLCARTASDLTVLKLHLVVTSYTPVIL
jgi:hypothetical protein